MTTFEDPRYNLTPEEAEAVDLIRRRIARTVGEIPYVYLFATIDVLLAAVHQQRPLDFGRLLDCVDGHFWHDISGILLNADFATGTFRLPFEPRCARELH